MSRAADNINFDTGHPRRTVVLWGLAAFVVLGFGVYYATAPRPPAINLNGVDPVVGRAIRQARQRVWLLPRSGAAWGQLAMILTANSFNSSAATCFLQAKRFDPTNPCWPYLHGAFTMFDRPDRALPLLKHAVELSGDEPPAVRLRLAELLVEMNRLDEAEVQLQRVLARDPNDARALLGMGRLSFARGDNMEACRDYLQQSIRPTPTRAAHLLLASVQYRLGNPQAAEQERKLAGNLPERERWDDPYRDRLQEFEIGLPRDVARGAALLAAGRIAETVELMQRATREHPTTSQRAWRLLGDAYFETGDLAAARKAFEQGLKAGGPPTTLLHFGLARIHFKEGKYGEAADQLRAEIRLEPKDPKMRNDLGRALVAQGQTGEAIAEYREALRLKPDYPEAHLNLGAAVASQGKVAEAIGHFDEALRIMPDYVDAHYNLGLLLHRMGKLAAAIEHYEQVLRFKGDNAETAPVKLALAAAREAKEAIERYEQALRSKPDDSKAHNNLGNVLRQIGQVTEAIYHYKQALQIQPDNAEVRYNLAVALAQTGNMQEAIGQYTEALRLNPDFLPALNNLSWIRVTNADSQLRDGTEAVRLAERACQLTNRRDVGYLDTLAAAYAETGRFTEAVATAEEALVLVNSANQTTAASEIQSRLALYRVGKPFRESPHPISPEAATR